MKTSEPNKAPAEKLEKVVALCAINYGGEDYNEGDEFEVTPFYAELWIGNQTVALVKAEK